MVSVAHLVSMWIAESLVLHAQVTHLGHELVRVDEEARTEQEGEDVRSLRGEKKPWHKRS